MPRLNGTGPNGMGPTTGRGMGDCAGGGTDAGAGTIGLGLGRGANAGLGLGLGRGARRGCGRRIGVMMTSGVTDNGSLDEAEEKALLNLEATRLETQLKNVRGRLNSMDQKE